MTDIKKTRRPKTRRYGLLFLALAGSSLMMSSFISPNLPAQTQKPETAVQPEAPGEKIDYFSQYLIDNAKNSIERQRYDQAIDFINRALENHPDNIEFLFLAADVEERLENWAGAESRFNSILNLSSDNAEAKAKRGLIRWYMGSLEPAAEDLDAALNIGLNDSRLKARAENALREAKAGRRPPQSESSARRDYSRIDEDWSMVAIMEENEDWAGLERFYTRLLEQSPKEVPYAYASRGFARLSQGKLEEAGADFQAALKQPGLEAQTRKVVQETLEQLETGRRKAAAWEARQATIVRLEARSDWAGLDRFYTEELAQNPDSAAPLTARGFVRLNLGRFDEGEKDLLQALDHKDVDAATKDIIRQTLAGLEAGRADAEKWRTRQDAEARLQKNRDWAGLEKLYTEMVEDYPDNSFVISSRGFARLNMGRFKEARADFVTALAFDDLDPQTRKAIEETMAAIDSNLEKSTEWEEVQATVARLEKKKDWPALERYYSELMETKAHLKLFALTSRGFVRLAQNKIDAAEADFRAGLRLNPDSQARAGLNSGLEEVAKARRGKAAAPAEPAAGPAQPAEPEFDPDAPAVSPGRHGASSGKTSRQAANKNIFREAAVTWGQADGWVDVWADFKLMQQSLQARRFDELADRTAKLSGLNLKGEERGHLAYFEGEVLWYKEQYDQAYPLYAEAEGLVSENYRRSDILWRMAEYSRLKGETGAAAEYAHQSVALIPNEYWRLNVAGFMLASLGRDQEAVDYFQRSLALKEPNRQEVGLYYQTANAYNRLGEKDTHLDYLRLYIDKATDFYQEAPEVEQHEAEELYSARRTHSYLTRDWGLDSYIFGTDYENDDYSIQMLNELYGNIRHADMIFQPYLQLNGSLASRYSGTYYEPWLNRNLKWAGNSHLRESMYGIAGLRVYPFLKTSHSLSFGVEQVFKIGAQTRNDTRLRLNHFWHTGLDLEPYVTNWLYVMTVNQATWSSRNNDLTAFGEVRGGRSLRLDFIDDRLVLTPHMSVAWGYGGENVDKGQRWSLEAGPGLSLRKWYREDRYNAPRSSSDITIQYRWGLSHERNDALFLTLSNSF